MSITHCDTSRLFTSHAVCVQALQDLVAQCLQTDPKARPSACRILKHKFFKVRQGHHPY